MPNTLTMKGEIGTVFVGLRQMGTVRNWTKELIGEGRHSFSAEKVEYDQVLWPFRDRSLPVTVNLRFRGIERAWHVMLTSEDPFAGEVSLDANTAEDMW